MSGIRARLPIPRDSVLPVCFNSPSLGAAVYLAEPGLLRLTEFFKQKGLAALKAEDREERWYDDWIAYQAEHGLYANVLTPAALSSNGGRLDLVKLTRFWEAAAYFSPAHAYSLHVTFLGLFPLLRSNNLALKREAVARLEAGGLFAFAVSEKGHGADLLGNEFTVTELPDGRLSARGSKHYIGNAQSAAMISVLARGSGREPTASTRRAPMLFFALRPLESSAVRNVRKIRTLGVRSAFVAAFDVEDHLFPPTDIICDGRDAWESVFATVSLGKFFLGFGSIGMCEHALVETIDHTRRRILYGKPVIQMPHIRSALAFAYARLAAMKLYAYRALDYVHAACDADRRFLFYAAVQKAQVSVEGVKVMAQLTECIGARGFESDTYFESALREVPLVPVLEGSTHVNLRVVAQLSRAYFDRRPAQPPAGPPSLLAMGDSAGENDYLLTGRASDLRGIRFAYCTSAYRPLSGVANVALFARQVRTFRVFARRYAPEVDPRADTEIVLAMGRCLAIIAFAQLVAEHSTIVDVPDALVSVMFHHLVEDLSQEASKLAALPQIGKAARAILARVPALPCTQREDLDFVADRVMQLKR